MNPVGMPQSTTAAPAALSTPPAASAAPGSTSPLFGCAQDRVQFGQSEDSVSAGKSPASLTQKALAAGKAALQSAGTLTKKYGLPLTTAATGVTIAALAQLGTLASLGVAAPLTLPATLAGGALGLLGLFWAYKKSRAQDAAPQPQQDTPPPPASNGADTNAASEADGAT